jgi:glycoside hydrolase-like protein
MPSFKGVDYAFLPHPSPAAMKAAGVVFVGRYVSSFGPNDTNGKNLIPAEKTALLAAGLQIILFAEEASGRMLGGRSAGVADAEHFDAVTKALGLAGIAMYCAADFDASPTQQVPINNYLDGAASVIGRSRTGIYGSYYVVKRALDAAKATYACQTLAWSGPPQRHDPHTFWDAVGQTNWDTRAQVRQHLQIRVGSVSVDLDQAFATDYGQYPRPSKPIPPPASPIAVTANGSQSWRDLAHAHGTTVQRSVYLTAKNSTETSPEGFPQPRIAAAISNGDWNAPLPQGVQIWVG